MPEERKPPKPLDTSSVWWRLEYEPGTRRRLGAERRIASYLSLEVGEGGTFAMRTLREVLGSGGKPNADEHLNRRMRKLRSWNWRIDSAQDDVSLAPSEYRIVCVGWSPEVGGSAPRKLSVSARVRAQVFADDGYRCVLCGRAGTDYQDDGSLVSLTVGHIVPQALSGTDDRGNLRTECSLCNEPKRNEGRHADTFNQLLPTIRQLTRAEKRQLLQWVKAGQRRRSQVDEIFDRVRLMNREEQRSVERYLTTSAGESKG